MPRPVLTLVPSGRSRPFEEEHHTVAPHDWMVVVGKTIFLSIACATLLWSFAALVLSLGLPR